MALISADLALGRIFASGRKCPLGAHVDMTDIDDDEPPNPFGSTDLGLRLSDRALLPDRVRWAAASEPKGGRILQKDWQRLHPHAVDNSLRTRVSWFRIDVLGADVLGRRPVTDGSGSQPADPHSRQVQLIPFPRRRHAIVRRDVARPV